MYTVNLDLKTVKVGYIGSLNLQNKVVQQYENTSGSGVCHVKILDKYLQVLPPEAADKDVFYLTPLPKVPTDHSKPLFKAVPVWKNRLNTMLKEMCAEAGIAANYTNYSLRAYDATTMFQAGVSEKLIKGINHCANMSAHQNPNFRMCQTLFHLTNILVPMILRCFQSQNPIASNQINLHHTKLMKWFHILQR